MTENNPHLKVESVSWPEFEALFSNLSSRFVGIAPSAVDAEIEDAQRLVCKHFGLDACFLWQWDTDEPDILRMTHLSRPDGGPPVPERMAASEYFPWSLQKMKAGETIILSSLEDAPVDAARDVEVCRQLGVKSTLAIPLSTGEGPTFGAVGFNYMTKERSWAELVVLRLQLIAQIFAHTLAHKRSDELLYASDQILRRQLEFETLVSDISARFMRLAVDEVDREIEAALEQLLTFFDVDRCGVLQVSADKKTIRITHDAYCGDTKPISKELNLTDILPWTYQKLIVKQIPALIECMSDLPPEAEIDRQWWAATGTKSTLTIPLVSVQGLRYLLGMHCVRKSRTWPKNYLPRLMLLGEILVNALDRREAEFSLRESEVRMRLAAESSGAGFWTFDPDSGRFWSTAQARELFKFTSDQVTLKSFLEAVHPLDRDRVRDGVQQAIVSNEDIDIQYRILHPDGTLRWIASQGRSYSDVSGTSDRMMGVSTDVTDMIQLQERIQNAAKEWQITFDAIHDLVLVLDREFKIQKINRAAEHFLGTISKSPVAGCCFKAIFNREVPSEDCPLRRAFVSKHHEESEIYLEQKDVWFQISTNPILDETGKLLGFVNVLKDITARKTYELRLQDYQVKLRSYASQLLSIQEEERRHLARELHDDFSQRLAVLAMDLSNLEMSATPAGQEWKPMLQRLRGEIIKLSTDILGISRQLHPSIIDDLGLGRAIESECRQFLQRTGIKIHYRQIGILKTIPSEIAVILFRVTQEAIRNIHKHAQVEEAEVTLACQEPGLKLTICDAGVGFEYEKSREAHGLGLFSMKERIQLIKGDISIQSSAEHGTRVAVTVPLLME